jgi:large subunit ribosomal protein L22
MEIKAVQKFVRMSPRKLRLVVPMVKDLKPAEALEILPHIGKRAAEPISKVIKTALANAKEKGINERDLFFKEIQINDGPRLKRWRPGARGRVKPYQRKMSHIRVILESKEPEPIKKARKEIAEAKKTKKSALQRKPRSPLPRLRKKSSKGSSTNKKKEKTNGTKN